MVTGLTLTHLMPVCLFPPLSPLSVSGLWHQKSRKPKDTLLVRAVRRAHTGLICFARRQSLFIFVVGLCVKDAANYRPPSKHHWRLRGDLFLFFSLYFFFFFVASLGRGSELKKKLGFQGASSLLFLPRATRDMKEDDL